MTRKSGYRFSEKIMLKQEKGFTRAGAARKAPKARHLSFGFPAAGALGVLDRAEPAVALADLHLDLGVPAAFRRVKDAFAGAVDIALDGAVGRRRNRPGGRGQQDRVRVWRRLGRAQYRRLLVADTPVPWRDEGARPHPGLGFARGLLVGVVVMGAWEKGQPPAVLHHPFLDVLAVDSAARDITAAAIDA